MPLLCFCYAFAKISCHFAMHSIRICPYLCNMAKQTGPIKITGTIGNICFYEMDGKFYARLKSSLTGKRVKKDPRFRLTMVYADLLVQASKLASCCYRSLPEEERAHPMYRALTGLAMKMLKAGMDPEEIAIHLNGVYRKEEVVTDAPSEKLALARPRMHVGSNGRLVFCLSCSKTNTVRVKTGQPKRHSPLIINAITTGIPFVPN